MPSKLIFTQIDNSRELTSTNIWGMDISEAANVDNMYTLADALVVAMENVTLGNTYRTDYVITDESIPPGVLDPLSTVHDRWQVFWEEDVSGQDHVTTLPTADPSLLVPNTDYADMTNVSIQLFVGPFENIVEAPISGEGALVRTMKYTGNS